MKIFLKSFVQKTQANQAVVNLIDRLPVHVQGPCQLTCDFFVKSFPDYYRIDFNATGPIEIICQRCLKHFCHDYAHQTQLAVCENEETATKLMNQFECIVAPFSEVDLVDILTDDLYLFVPEKHAMPNECQN